jgi:hypothetical protein
MSVSRKLVYRETDAGGAGLLLDIIPVLLPSGFLAGWNAELALSLLSGVRVLVEDVDALEGVDDSALPTSHITPEEEEKHRVGM